MNCKRDRLEAVVILTISYVCVGGNGVPQTKKMVIRVDKGKIFLITF